MQKKRFNATKVVSEVLTSGKTLYEVAEEFGYEYEAFCKKLEECVPPPKFAQVKKTSEKIVADRERLKKRKKSDPVKKALAKDIISSFKEGGQPKHYPVSQDVMDLVKEEVEPKIKVTSSSVSKIIMEEKDKMAKRTAEVKVAEATKKETTKVTKKATKPAAKAAQNEDFDAIVVATTSYEELDDVEDLEAFKKKEIEMLAALESGKETLLKTKEITEERLSSAITALEAARAAVKKAEEEKKSAERSLKEVTDQISESDKMIRTHESSIAKIGQMIENLSVVYLVSPDLPISEYPDSDHVISSTSECAGKVIVETGEALIEDKFAKDIAFAVKCGFGDLDDYQRALEFAKLCIKYALEKDDVKFKILATERTLAVVKAQGIDL